jgi:hypothetical protein
MEFAPWKGQWRLTASVALFSLFCYWALRVFHRHTSFAAMSLDSFALFGATLFAAALGFGAILLQSLSSAAQLRQQLADQHESVRRGQRRQVAVVAKALLVEIQDFTKYYITGLEKVLTGVDVANLTRENLPWLGSHPLSRFEIYDGNVGRLGEFDEVVIQSIVHFYKAASEHFAGYGDYKEAFARLNTPCEASESYEDAKYCLKIVSDSLPTLLKLAEDACEKLARIATSSVQ